MVLKDSSRKPLPSAPIARNSWPKAVKFSQIASYLLFLMRFADFFITLHHCVFWIGVRKVLSNLPAHTSPWCSITNSSSQARDLSSISQRKTRSMKRVLLRHGLSSQTSQCQYPNSSDLRLEKNFKPKSRHLPFQATPATVIVRPRHCWCNDDIYIYCPQYKCLCRNAYETNYMLLGRWLRQTKIIPACEPHTCVTT